MGLRKKKSLVDQAGDYVNAARPHVEAALGTARDFVQDTALPAISDARDKAGPALADARDKAAPVIADARTKAAANLADARTKAAPIIASGAALAAEKAGEARVLADAKVAQLKGQPEPKPKKGKLKKFVLVATLAGGIAFVAKKLQGGSSNADNWQSSYTPSAPPTAAAATSAAPAAPAVPTPNAPQSGLEEDAAGASPDEALADSATAPHQATTPDDPAEVIELDPQGDHSA